MVSRGKEIQEEAGDKRWKSSILSPGVYTILEVKAGQGSKTGIGFISLDFVQKR